MESRREIDYLTLSLHLFNVITSNFSKKNQLWNLADHVSPDFLQNKILILRNIDFSLFGYQLNQISFARCRLVNCSFVDQIITKCDFSNCVVEDTCMQRCSIDEQTKNSLPQHIFEYSSCAIKLLPQALSMTEKREYCNTWLMTIGRNIEKWIREKEADPLAREIMTLNYFQIFKCFNNHYDMILEGFKHKSHYCYENFFPDHFSNYYRGWKLHLSVEKNSVKKAYDIVAPILLDQAAFLTFKVIDLNVLEADNKQFTIYLYQKGLAPLCSPVIIKNLLMLMTRELKRAGILPGVLLVPDLKTISPYFGMRNDGENVIEYYDAGEAGRNSNPYNLPCPFFCLLPKPLEPFDVSKHYEKFRDDTTALRSKALIATACALVNEYLEPEEAYLFARGTREIVSDNKYDNYAALYQLQKKCKKNISKTELFYIFYPAYLLYQLDTQRYKRQAMLAKFLEDFFVRESLSCQIAKDDYGTLFHYDYKNAMPGFRSNLLHQFSRLLFLHFNLKVKPTNHGLNGTSNSLFNPHPILNEYFAYFNNISWRLRNFIQQHVQQFSSLMMDNKQMTIHKLGEMPEQTQALLITYAHIANCFPTDDVAIEDLKNCPVNILYLVLTRYDELIPFFKQHKLSLRLIKKEDADKWVLLLIDPEKTSFLLRYFNIKLYHLHLLPESTCLALLSSCHPEILETRKTDISFEKLIMFDDSFIPCVMQNISLGKLPDEVLIDLSQQPGEVQKHCAQNSKHLLDISKIMPIPIGQFYKLSKLHPDLSTSQLTTIVYDLKIPVTQLLELTCHTQKAICNDPAIILEFLKAYSFSMNELNQMEEKNKWGLMISAAILLDMKGNIGLTRADIDAAIKTINIHMQTNFYDLYFKDKTFLALIEKGVPFSRIFVLSADEFHKLHTRITHEKDISPFIRKHFRDVCKREQKSEKCHSFRM